MTKFRENWKKRSISNIKNNDILCTTAGEEETKTAAQPMAQALAASAAV